MNKLYAQIHTLSEQAQLSVIWREIKFKKVVFSELPNEFILFKQFNISAKKIYQNLLALHSMDASHQEVIPVEDIYAITNSMDSLSMRKQGKGKRPKDNADYVAQFPVKASIAIRSARKCVSLDVSKYTYQSQCIDKAKSIVTKAVTTALVY